MSNLARRWSWKKWAPDIGENLEARPEGPLLYLEIATGISARQMAEVGEVLRKANNVRLVAPEAPVPTSALTPEEAKAQAVAYAAAVEAAVKVWLVAVRAVYVEALGELVRVADGPHTVDGLPCNTLDEYLQVVELGANWGMRARRELEAAFARYNSVEGPDELFSQRSSGGERSTGRTARTGAR